MNGGAYTRGGGGCNGIRKGTSKQAVAVLIKIRFALLVFN